MPIVSVDAMRLGFFGVGAKYGDIAYFSKPADWKFQLPTPNSSSLYVYFARWSHSSTRAGSQATSCRYDERQIVAQRIQRGIYFIGRRAIHQSPGVFLPVGLTPRAIPKNLQPEELSGNLPIRRLSPL